MTRDVQKYQNRYRLVSVEILGIGIGSNQISGISIGIGWTLWYQYRYRNRYFLTDTSNRYQYLKFLKMMQ